MNEFQQFRIFRMEFRRWDCKKNAIPINSHRQHQMNHNAFFTFNKNIRKQAFHFFIKCKDPAKAAIHLMHSAQKVGLQKNAIPIVGASNET
jgi:hypothetical protein